MLITPEEIEQRLRWVRESQQITQEAASAALGLQCAAISLMESGQRQVSTLELTHLADLYGRPVEWFVDPSRPIEQEDPVVALFRAELGLQREVIQKQVRRCLRLLREGASLRRLTGGRAAVSLPRYELPPPRSVGQAIAQGQLVAEQGRRPHEHGHALMDRDEATTVTSAHNAKTRTEQRAKDEASWDHELAWQILSLALEAWWRGEISQGRLLEVGRLLDIDDETILDLAE